jgi:hypothetical protein
MLLLDEELQDPETPALATYKLAGVWCMRASRLSRTMSVKIVVEFQFEAVLGKTRRTEF